MNRYTMLPLAVLLQMQVFLFAENSRSDPPNIVVYLADDLSFRDVSVYSQRGVSTPGLETLAADGMTFDYAFVASPSCAPSRAALLTGLMPARNGAEENHSQPSEAVTKLPKTLKKLGYQLAAFGKVAHSKSAKNYGFEIIEAAKDIPILRTKVESFLNQRDDPRPLALFVGTSNPHVPWPSETSIDANSIQLPPTFVDTPRTRVQRSRYLQEVKDLDSYLIELRALAKRLIGPDHIFVFSSDHGAQFPLGKWTLYDEGTRVPMLVSWPGKISGGRRSNAMVSWIDLLPTLIDLSGGEAPRGIDGRSFANVLLGKTDSHRDVVFTTHSGDRMMNVYPIRSVRDARFKYIRNPHPEFAFTTHIDLLLRETSGDYFTDWTEKAKSDADAAHKVARHHGRPLEELYDCESDPHEQRNLANDPAFADRKNAMSQKLDRWMKSQGDNVTVFHVPLMLDEPKTWKPRDWKAKR
ncbi:MAG: sulfatase [Planctomycetota bacterium]